MAVRHDPLLARALALEIGSRWGSARAAALILDRDRRAAELRFREGPPLLFLLHPEAGFLLSGEGGEGDDDPETGGELAGTAETFRRLFLMGASAPPDERALLLRLGDRRGRERHRVAVELHGNQWNLLLLDVLPSDRLRVRAALWPRVAGDRVLRAGAEYALPSGRREGVERPLDSERWRSLLQDVPPANRRRTALRHVAWLSSVNVDWVLGAAAEEVTLESAYRRYRLVWEAAWTLTGDSASEVGCHLLEGRRGRQPYPLALDQPEAPVFPSTLEAMAAAAEAAGARERFVAPGGVAAGAAEAARAEEAGRLRDALLARREAASRRRAALRRELEEGEDPEELRAAGNLLLARLREVPRGAKRVVLRDFEGGERELELDPRLDPAANAAAYFDRAARRERAAERIPRELQGAARRLQEVETALDRLEAEGPSDPLWELAGGRPGGDGGSRAGEETLPYLRYRTSGGLELRVGRSARANDDLTFHHSSPEDVWLHARQAKGAHVILRWGRREGNPPRRDLVEAAVAAAVHSGARHSGTVPVDWTRRKYVRKPRKAPPGAVVPEQVKTLFVHPDEKLLEKLSAK